MVDNRTPGDAPKRVVLAHDWLVGYRGGEGVLHHAARAFESIGCRIPLLLSMFDDGRPLTPEIDALPRRISFLNGLAGPGCSRRRWLLPLYRYGVDHLSRELMREHARTPIDMVLSTSSAAIKNLRAPAGVRHVCYCHSPARYLWSQTDQYGGGLRGLGLRALGPSFRAWDARTANVDLFLANSSHTAREIERCYGRESIVLHPPVRTGLFTPDPDAERESFWLCAGALESYKRYDLAIEAANERGHELVIAGRGSDEARLRSLAGATVRFAGRVPDDELVSLMRRARCFLFPQVEDFGIVAAEALACGTPVVARRAGGALDMVEDGVHGVLFDEPSPESLAAAIDRCPGGEESSSACRSRAEAFSIERFERGLLEAIALS